MTLYSSQRQPLKVRAIDEHIADKNMKKEAKSVCNKEIEEFAKCTSQVFWLRKCNEYLHKMNDCLRQASSPERYLQLLEEQVKRREARRDNFISTKTNTELK